MSRGTAGVPEGVLLESNGISRDPTASGPKTAAPALKRRRSHEIKVPGATVATHPSGSHRDARGFVRGRPPPDPQPSMLSGGVHPITGGR